MVTIPKVLTNKTVYTGLSQSLLKSSSVFKPTMPWLDHMGATVTVAEGTNMGRISNFTANISAKPALIPEGLSKPFYVQGYGVSFRKASH